jgi:hypothetical protein
MIQETLIDIFDRDLNKLIAEINLYNNEADLWVIKEGISNSAGNLCLHLIGNLNHFIGSVQGNTGYVREREKEFSDKNIPAKDLVHSIEKTMVVVKESLAKLSAADFEKIFPLEVFGKPLKTELFMVHLATHLSYHLGQINYHRRLLN